MTVSLLGSIQGLIERTYGTETGISDMERFVVGDRGFDRLAERHPIVRVVEDERAAARRRPGGPQVLVRPLDQGAAVAVYFPDDLIARLENRPPTRGLDGENVDDFAAFIEEIDHFIQIAHGISARRQLNLLELEIRANISKALVLQHFIAKLTRRTSLNDEERRWVRFHLFDKHRYVDEDRRVRRRYEEARRFAVTLLDCLGEMPAAERVARLRRWNALPAVRKLRLGTAALA